MAVNIDFTSDKTQGYLDDGFTIELTSNIQYFADLQDSAPDSIEGFKYIWKLGDGTVSDIIDPSLTTGPYSHTYESEGEFDVSIYVWADDIIVDDKSKSYSTTLTKLKYIQIVDIDIPVADFLITPQRIETRLETTYDDNKYCVCVGDGNDESCEWDQVYVDDCPESCPTCGGSVKIEIKYSDVITPYLTHNVIEDETVRFLNTSTGGSNKTEWYTNNDGIPNVTTRDMMMKFFDMEDTEISLRVSNERGSSVISKKLNVIKPEIKSITYKDDEGNTYVSESKEQSELSDVIETLVHDFAKRRMVWNNRDN